MGEPAERRLLDVQSGGYHHGFADIVPRVEAGCGAEVWCTADDCRFNRLLCNDARIYRAESGGGNARTVPYVA
ncbi:hypothetical protein D3C74_431070 [compost metagenome]